MARKPAPRSKAKTAGKAALAQRSKDAEAPAAKAKSDFGKRSMASTQRSAAVHAKPAKSPVKTQRKSVIGKAVEAVTSTVSTVAESATSLFRRGPAKTH
jgi:hypothetical protein